MKKVKCPDCGTEYPVNLKACPECGCPNDKWEEIVEDETPKEEASASSSILQEHKSGQKIQLNKEQPTQKTSSEKTDWANYVYECGLLFWHSISRRYFKTSSRASRREFWSFTIILNVLLSPYYIARYRSTGMYYMTEDSFLLQGLIILALFLPFLAVSVRRMHDIGKSGWWIFVPVANFFLSLKKSDEGENKYGEPAKDDI